MAAAALMTALIGPPAHSQLPLPLGDLKDQVASTACPALQTGPGGHAYKYCGLHWRKSKLPIRFKLNIAGMPSSLATLLGGQTQFEQAARQAASVWDAPSPVSGTGTRPSACGGTKIVCIESVGAMGVVDPSDGVNVIRWDALGPNSYTALANVTLDPAGGNRISDVDIVLNSSHPWYWSGAPMVTGLAVGAVAFICGPTCNNHRDVQSILMHEIGHAVGLQHPNPGSQNTWPTDAEDAPDYNLVMYERYFPNNATQRALQWGDLIGLQVVMRDSAADS